MTYPSRPVVNDSSRQAIQGPRVGPTNSFIEFKKEEIEQSIPDRFEQQVAKYPDRLAVKTKNHTFTYDQLNQAANRVAHAILAKQGKRAEPIALLLEKDASMIAAILGVLKGGNIYVPLDPFLPRRRLRTMLEDLQARLIVTNDKNLLLARDLANGMSQLLNVDALHSKLYDANLAQYISPDAPAFILYTSGSTGQPKAVIHSHRNTLNEVRRHTNAFHVCTDNRLSFLLPANVIGGVREILLALLNGAVLCPFDIKEEGLAGLADWLIQEEITICRFVSTVFRKFGSSLVGEQFPKLRLIYVGGEPVIKRDVELYKTHFSPDCIFVNVIGATETGIFRHYFINKESRISGENVPVGYAVENMEILLLDNDGRELGFNHVGEIAVKSRYLSPGYWHNPELTKAVFLSDPQGGKERIYLTGDLGRMRPDGCLEHVGRKDFQVKIRGNRVEVAEIEMALLELATIKEAVVVAQGDRPDEQRLVAYLVPATQPAPTVSELRRILNERFPHYMVPSAFVFLDALPLTPNGKVDRLALPAPGRARPELEVGFMAPRTRVEDMLMGFWAEALVLDQVGVHDNFFALGGHSLLATQVISRINDAFNINLSPASLYETPTVSALAIAIVKRQNEVFF